MFHLSIVRWFGSSQSSVTPHFIFGETISRFLFDHLSVHLSEHPPDHLFDHLPDHISHDLGDNIVFKMSSVHELMANEDDN